VQRDHPGIEDDVQRKRGEVDVPGFDQGIQERVAVVPRQVEDVGIEEVENDDPGFLEASATQLRHLAEPGVVGQFSLGYRGEQVEEPLGNQPLQLAEGLPFEDGTDVGFLIGVDLAKDQLAHFPEEGCPLIAEFLLHFLPALNLRQPGQLSTGQFQEPVHLGIDVGPARRGRRLLPGEQLRDVRLGHPGGASELPLLQAECLQPLPNHQRDIHGVPPRRRIVVN
jgi:hypothetical protein